MTEKLITGIINPKDNNVLFLCDEERNEFIFLCNRIYKFGEHNKPITIDTDKGFITGKTNTNKNVAIYVGETDFEIFNNRRIVTGLYFVSCHEDDEESLDEFKSIVFVGGILNDLFEPKSMKIEYDEVQKKQYIIDEDDSININTIIEKENVHIIIKSSHHYSEGKSGISINNKDVTLEMRFEKQHTYNEFIKHYLRILDMLSFMTYRRNIGFDNIFLRNEKNNINVLLDYAEVRIHENEQRTQKHYFNNIPFEKISNNISQFLDILYNVKDNKPSYNFGFIPEKDKNVFLYSPIRIKEICSALECELSILEDPNKLENKSLLELKNKIKDIIKDYKKDNKEISDDTYQTIYGSMAYWTQPLSDRICTLYHKYQAEIIYLLPNNSLISDNDIKAFVKYRNDITHGRHRILTQRLAETAYILCGVIYCSFLSRIGVENETILDFCKNRMILL